MVQGLGLRVEKWRIKWTRKHKVRGTASLVQGSLDSALLVSQMF